MNPNQDTEHFMKVLAYHKGIIYKIANAYCQDPIDRQDLIQEIILGLWQNFKKYDSHYRYSTWIYRIALNLAISFYRKETRRKKISNPLTDNVFYLPNVEHHDGTDKKLLLLQQFSNELKELGRALLLLYLDEKSHKEIAAIMEILPTNVSTKIGRIKEALKLKFSQVKDL